MHCLAFQHEFLRCVDARFRKEKNVPSQRWTILCQTEFLWNVYPASGNLLCKEEIFYIGFSKFSDSDLLVSKDVLYRTFLTDQKMDAISFDNNKKNNMKFSKNLLLWLPAKLHWLTVAASVASNLPQNSHRSRYCCSLSLVSQKFDLGNSSFFCSLWGFSEF